MTTELLRAVLEVINANAFCSLSHDAPCIQHVRDILVRDGQIERTDTPHIGCCKLSNADLINAQDLYFLRDEEDEEGDSFYLVFKRFWEEHHCVDDDDFSADIWQLLPQWDGEHNGFYQDMESHFVYMEGEESSSKGIAIIQSLGIEEVLFSC
jgi:hypothetical protein